MTDLHLRRDKLQWIATDGEVVALDETTLMYLGVNTSATLLWEELVAGTTRERLIERLVEAYGIERRQSETDVDAFLTDLRERDLLE